MEILLQRSLRVESTWLIPLCIPPPGAPIWQQRILLPRSTIDLRTSNLTLRFSSKIQGSGLEPCPTLETPLGSHEPDNDPGPVRECSVSHAYRAKI